MQSGKREVEEPQRGRTRELSSDPNQCEKNLHHASLNCNFYLALSACLFIYTVQILNFRKLTKTEIFERDQLESNELLNYCLCFAFDLLCGTV